VSSRKSENSSIEQHCAAISATAEHLFLVCDQSCVRKITDTQTAFDRLYY